ncbi:hypothetical protein V5029_25400 [Enterobacter hormaechei]|uniref:hypothetical protein n=1 Tax=Enterobacter hormaechei TaxID=158836 RepID=UPI0030763079
MINREEKQIQSLKKKVDGPKVAKHMNGTVTIGVIPGNGNQSDMLQRVFHVNVNPIYLKDKNAGNAVTPLALTASDYALWKCTKFHVRLMPLVNSSVVSGTICVQSLDQNGQAAKDENIDDLLTRPYFETQLGGRTEWRVPCRKLEGQRQGWWEVDPNAESALSFGPAVDIHLYGTTYDLLKVSGNASNMTPYTGPLWIVQVVYGYDFANWEPKPALQTLINETVSVDTVTVQENQDGQLQVTVKQPEGINKLHLMTSTADAHCLRHNFKNTGLKAVVGAAAGQSLGSTIWQGALQIGDSVAEAVPGPWSWLIKGGLWFLRRVFNPSGLNDETESTYLVYPSVEDAQRNAPVTDTGLVEPVTFEPSDTGVFTQLNSTNVQVNSAAQHSPFHVDNRFPLPIGASMQNPLTTIDGLILNGTQIKGAWSLVGQAWEPSFIHGNSTNKLQYHLKTMDVTPLGRRELTTVEFTLSPLDDVYYVVMPFITQGKVTGDCCLMGNHNNEWSEKYRTTGRGPIGDGWSIIRALAAQPSSVNFYGGFYRCQQGLTSPGAIYYTLNDAVQARPAWFGNTDDCWGCTVTWCSYNAGFLENWGLIVVNTRNKSIGYFGLTGKVNGKSGPPTRGCYVGFNLSNTIKTDPSTPGRSKLPDVDVDLEQAKRVNFGATSVDYFEDQECENDCTPVQSEGEESFDVLDARTHTDSELLRLAELLEKAGIRHRERDSNL